MINGNLVCDFCSSAGPAWRYPARTFIAYRVSTLAGESVGDWAACETCRRLIEADDRRGLAERSVEQLISDHPELRELRADLCAELMRLHGKFFENRCGDASGIEAGDCV
jgi:hypothetical protein